MVPMRWPASLLARMKAALHDGESRSAFIRTAVEAELDRRKPR